MYLRTSHFFHIFFTRFCILVNSSFTHIYQISPLKLFYTSHGTTFSQSNILYSSILVFRASCICIYISETLSVAHLRFWYNLDKVFHYLWSKFYQYISYSSRTKHLKLAHITVLDCWPSLLEGFIEFFPARNTSQTLHTHEVPHKKYITKILHQEYVLIIRKQKTIPEVFTFIGKV